MLIKPGVSPHRILLHLGACASYASLFRFARDRGDLEALARWRTLLAEHLANEQRDYDHEVLARLGAYRRARRETEVA